MIFIILELGNPKFYQSALDDFESALNLFPDDPGVLENMVIAYDKLGKIQEAEAVRKKIKEVTRH